MIALTTSSSISVNAERLPERKPCLRYLDNITVSFICAEDEAE